MYDICPNCHTQEIFNDYILKLFLDNNFAPKTNAKDLVN